MARYGARHPGWWVGTLAAAAAALLCVLAGPPAGVGDGSPDRPREDLSVPGRLTVGRDISLPGFRLGQGGLLEWPGKLRLGHGGGEGHGLPPKDGLIRARPGGNLVLEPQGDYMRCAIDLLPPRGKQADVDAIGEFTIHRVHPTARTQEMISYSALARHQDMYAVVVEAHGDGRLKPLAFMDVRGGLNPGEEPFSAEAMRMTEDGTMVFGLHRQGGRLQRPVDSITIDQPPPAAPGAYDSDYVKWVGKVRDGAVVHTVNWRANVQVGAGGAGSRFVVQSAADDGAYTKRLEVSDRGEVELPAGGALVLRSPNGKRWRVQVSDSGRLETRPADGSDTGPDREGK